MALASPPPRVAPRPPVEPANKFKPRSFEDQVRYAYHSPPPNAYSPTQPGRRSEKVPITRAESHTEPNRIAPNSNSSSIQQQSKSNRNRGGSEPFMFCSYVFSIISDRLHIQNHAMWLELCLLMLACRDGPFRIGVMGQKAQKSKNQTLV